MSLKNHVISFGVALGLGLVVFCVTQQVPGPEVVSNSKSVRFANQSQLRFGKPNSLIEAHISAQQGLPLTANDPTTLVVSFSWDPSLTEKLQYQWELPAGVQLVQGQLGEILDAANFEHHESQVTLVVRGMAKNGPSQNLIFNLSAQSHGTVVGTTAVFHSRSNIAAEQKMKNGFKSMSVQL